MWGSIDSLRITYYVLHVSCCTLRIAFFKLRITCYSVSYYMLHITDYIFLSHRVCYILRTHTTDYKLKLARFLHRTYDIWYITNYISHITNYISYIASNILRIAYHISHIATHSIPHITYYPVHATCCLLYITMMSCHILSMT